MGDGDTDAVAFTGDAAEWVRERAADRGVPPEEYATRLVAAVRTVETGDGADVAAAADVAGLAARVDALDDELDEKIDDVRERVVQVKREADAKADADHDHSTLATGVREAEATARAAEGSAADVEAAVSDLEDRLDAGFENYEAVLAALRDRTDALSAKVGTLAGVLVDVRDAASSLAEAGNRRTAVEELQREANREGVREAVCGDCGAAVDVALLTGPTCPFCEATFASVEPKRGFFGSATLAVGTRPALEAPAVVEDSATDLEEIADE